MSTQPEYLPALKFHILTPLFDPMLRWIKREMTFKRRLIKEASVEPRARVLDVGSGTGTLAILVKQMQPDARVVGIDADPQVIAIARKKASHENVDIPFDQGMAFDLPYPDKSFDRVLSSLVFHHLSKDNKGRSLAEAWRVLKPGGRILIVDFGKPQNALAWAISRFLQRLEPSEGLNSGLFPEFLDRAGFNYVEVVTRFMTAIGTLALYSGQKPG